ncbi:aminoglycoside phosphotransferase family protein [Pseudactinotalea sp.]|uniref:aminoglycoside phosphotransferase family protein n=1 Tax=Pseudactinotalea sp. TaxID=1926260 RepID=UPI003B3A472A
MDQEVLAGGAANRGNVVRIGDRVHRPRRTGADVAEALLLHLESVGYDAAPRFLGHDEMGRQILSYLPGDTYPDQRPPWLDDDEANARALGRIAAFVRDLHDATAGFTPPPGAEPFRPLPLPGSTWNHADVHYSNLVFDRDAPVALIDWECCAPGDPMYDPATLLLSARHPRPDRPADTPARARAARRTAEAVLTGYRATATQRAQFPAAIAATFDDVAHFIEHEDNAYSPQQRLEAPGRFRWIADWWRTQQV